MHTPAAESFLPGTTRKRPLIYVYELPSIFNTVMLQYRMGGADCVPRLYDVNNVTTLSGLWPLLPPSCFPHHCISQPGADVEQYYWKQQYPMANMVWSMRNGSSSLAQSWERVPCRLGIRSGVRVA